MSREENADPSSDDSKCPTCSGASKKSKAQQLAKNEDFMNKAGDRIINIDTLSNGTQIITVIHGETGEEIGTWTLVPP